MSIVRKWATLKKLVGLYMASPRIGSLNSLIKPIVIRPPLKLGQTKHSQKIINQLLVWGLIPTSLRNYEFFSNFQASGQSSTTLSSSSLAHKGTFLTALSTASHITPWIIDSGAFDHHLFSTYSSCAGNLKVKIADGTLSPVAGKRFIFLSLLLSTLFYMFLIYLAICCLLAS